MKKIEYFFEWLIKLKTFFSFLSIMLVIWGISWTFPSRPISCIIPVFFFAFYLPLLSSKLIKINLNASYIALIASFWIIFVSFSQFEYNYILNYFEWTKNKQTHHSYYNCHFYEYSDNGKIYTTIPQDKGKKIENFNSKLLPHNGFIGFLKREDLNLLKNQYKPSDNPNFFNRAVENSQDIIFKLRIWTVGITIFSFILFFNFWINEQNEKVNKKLFEEERKKRILEQEEKIKREADEKVIREAKEKKEREEYQKELENKRKAEAERKEQERIARRRIEYEGLPDIIKKNTSFEDFLGR